MAAGDAHLVNDIAGSPLSSGSPLVPGLLPGPYLALSSNSGRQVTDRVAIVPEVALKLRYRITESLLLTLGYDLLYWNRVHCPGDQMDPVINTTQILGKLSGQASPTDPGVNTDFFAQGLTAGLEWNF